MDVALDLPVGTNRELTPCKQYVMGYDHVAFDSYKDLFARTWLSK